MTRMIDGVLRDGVDDWVPFRTVHLLAHDGAAETDEPSLRQSAIDTVRELVIAGLVEIGSVTDAGFVAWSAPLTELNEFATRYLTGEASKEDDWAFRLWLSNTPAGDQRARLSRDRRP